MGQPTLMLAITDTELQTQLGKSSAIRQFQVSDVAANNHWIECLEHAPVDVAIVQVDEFGEKDLRRLVNGRKQAGCELIFVSDGNPNDYIDHAMRQGVSYHFRFPVDTAFLDEVIQELYSELTEDALETEEVVSSELDQFGLLVGSSKVMRKLYRIIRKAADSSTSVFIVGESGSGKELVANTVHLMSPRLKQPFVSLNCGAISPELIESELFGHVKGAFTGAVADRAGVFEQADGGTLFLDEITEMPIEHQVKLLRVLETGEFRRVGSEKLCKSNVRIVAATNRDPAAAIEEELFREDLYFRLAQFPIHVPSLRERGKDIVGLAKHFLAHRNAEENTAVEISVEALEKIEKHSWPGNVRELKHAIERAYILKDDLIRAEHIVLEEVGGSTGGNLGVSASSSLEEIEKAVILKTLEEKSGNKTETATQLGISIKTLYNKLEKYDEEGKSN